MADLKQEGGAGGAGATTGETQTINIVVRDQTGGEVHFKVKPHTKFTKVFDAYCSKKAVTQESIRFMYDGHRVQATQSPQDLDMEDGDVVDAVVEQLGGQAQA